MAETFRPRFDDRREHHPELVGSRRVHEEMDRAVLHAFSWDDVDTTCDFLPDWPPPPEGCVNRLVNVLWELNVALTNSARSFERLEQARGAEALETAYGHVVSSAGVSRRAEECAQRADAIVQLADGDVSDVALAAISAAAQLVRETGVWAHDREMNIKDPGEIGAVVSVVDETIALVQEGALPPMGPHVSPRAARAGGGRRLPAKVAAARLAAMRRKRRTT